MAGKSTPIPITPAVRSGGVVLVGPVADGTTGQILTTDGSGSLSFTTASGTGDLLAANNLSDVASAATSRTNLGLGTAATTDATDYATAAQGSLADSATQPSDNVSDLTNDAGYITTYTVTEGDVTAHEAALSITESQISDLGSYASTSHTHAASDIVSGTIATARLGSGTASSSTFLRGDNTWQTIGGGDALVANPLSQFASTTSAQLAGVISDETGSGALVFATSPTFVTPLLGTPTSGTLTNCTGLPIAGLASFTGLPVEFTLAVSDETTALTTGTGKITFRMPFAMTLTDVRASVVTAPTGSTLTVDINESGSTILSTKLTIDATEKTSETAAAAAVISDSSLADDAEITVDIDAVGATIAGAGLKITLIGTRA